MLNRVPPCRCKRPRDTKRFIQAVPLKSSCALWTFIAAHDRCVHTNGSAIVAHNSPYHASPLLTFAPRKSKGFSDMRSTKVRFHLCWSVIVPSTRNKGMVPPTDDSPVRAVRTLPQLPTTLIDLRTAGSSCIYIYIIDVSGTFLSEALNAKNCIIDHTSLVLSCNFP